MGLKGYRLWAMGQLDSTCRAPPRAVGHAAELLNEQRVVRGEGERQRHEVQLLQDGERWRTPPAPAVALQVAFLKGKI
jgi:hypothetical protein